MVAKRWSWLGVFLAGALSGAAALGLHSGRGGPESRMDSSASNRASDGGAPVRSASSTEELAAAHRPLAAAGPVALGPAKPLPDVQPLKAEPGEGAVADAGKSLSDVLARLEAEYRRAAASPRTEAHAPATREAQPPVARQEEASGAKSPVPTRATIEEPAAVQVAAHSAISNSAAHLAAVPAPENDSRFAANAAPNPSGPPREVPESALAGEEQQQVTAQIQQLATLQQLAVAQQIAFTQQLANLQQLALLQQLQLLAQPAAPAAKPYSRLPRRPAPSRAFVSVFSGSTSIGHTAPGFDYAPTVLVR